MGFHLLKNGPLSIWNSRLQAEDAHMEAFDAQLYMVSVAFWDGEKIQAVAAVPKVLLFLIVPFLDIGNNILSSAHPPEVCIALEHFF